MGWDHQNLFVIAGFVIVCFHIFYCNSARLSNVVHYNGVFVIYFNKFNIYSFPLLTSYSDFVILLKAYSFNDVNSGKLFIFDLLKGSIVGFVIEGCHCTHKFENAQYFKSYSFWPSLSVCPKCYKKIKLASLFLHSLICKCTVVLKPRKLVFAFCHNDKYTFIQI